MLLRGILDEAQSVPILSKTIPIRRYIKGKEKGKGGGKKISSKEMGEKGIVLLKSGTDWALSNSLFFGFNFIIVKLFIKRCDK